MPIAGSSNIARSYFVQGTNEHKAVQRVQERLGLSIQRYGGQNALFRELNRYYLSLSPRIMGRENDRPSNSKTSREPDIFVGRSFAIVESAVPPWVFGVFGGSPPIRVHGRKQEYQDKAQAAEDLVTYDFDRAQVLYKSIHVGKQVFKYGTGIAKIGYRYDSHDVTRKYRRSIPAGYGEKGVIWKRDRFRQTDNVIDYDGPDFEPVSVYNFHPDPYYWELERDRMRYVNYRRWTDRISLAKEDEQHYKFTGKRKYQHLDKIPRMKTGYIEEVYQMDNGDDLGEAMGWSSAFDTARSRYTGTGPMDKYEDLVEVIEYWSPQEDRVIYIANGEVPILDGEHPYDDKDFPFVVARDHVMENQFWGYGHLHFAKRPQEELNSLRNLNMRQTQLNVLKIWGYDEATGWPQIGTHLNPGDMLPIPFYANGNPGLVDLFGSNQLPPEAFVYEDRIDADMMTGLAMANYRAGTGGDTDTATEASINAEQSQSRIRLSNLGASLTFGANTARLFISRRQQFLKAEGEQIRILGPEGPVFKQITRQDIAGEYDFVPGGQHIMPGKDVLRQQMLQMWALIANNPVLQNMTDMSEAWLETWKLMDFDHPKRFVSPPQEKTIPPEYENKVLKYGEWIEVNVMDNHERHLELHRQLMGQMIQSEAPVDHLENIQQHIREHEAMVQQQQQEQGGAAPPQEQPGLRGYAGNVPNLENAVETSAGLQARMRGAAGGGR